MKVYTVMTSHDDGRMRRGLIGIALAMWTASLMLPAMQINGFNDKGWSWALWGVIGLTLGYVEWLANPLLLLCAIMLWRGMSPLGRGAWFAALIAVMVIALMRTTYPVNEGGQPYPVEQHLIGYYFWLGSLGVMAFALVFRTREQS